MRNKLLFLALPLLFGLQASAQKTQAFQDTTLSDEPVSYTHLHLYINGRHHSLACIAIGTYLAMIEHVPLLTYLAEMCIRDRSEMSKQRSNRNSPLPYSKAKRKKPVK